MEEVFKKYLWVVKLVGLAVVLGFAVSAAVAYVNGGRAVDEDLGRAAVTAPEGVGQGDADRREEARPVAKAKVAAYVASRNPFCPTCAPLEVATGDVSLPPSTPREGDAPKGPAVKSTLPLALIATMESDDPTASLATLADTERGKVGSFGIGDAVRDGVTLVDVQRGRVILLNGSRREYVELGPAVAAAGAEPRPEGEPPPPPKKNDRKIEGAEEAISCEGDSCTVDRAFVDRALANSTQLAKQARIVPSIRDGETLGYKVYGVRPGSLPRLLGIKNGDTIKSVNGKELTSMDQAMDTLASVKKASSLSVVLDRRGTSITKDITIK